MFYKLSNTSNLTDIEADFDAKFKFPNLYKTAPIINGLTEQSLPIITAENSNQINYAIWGLLPQNFKEGWESFQKLTNTLNTSIDEIAKLNWTYNILSHQRCVIIVSGFFTSYLYNGEVYPFYVYEKNQKPFALAGVYSVLNDGFLSVSVMTSAVRSELLEMHNLGENFPIALSQNEYKDWLNLDVEMVSFRSKINRSLELRAHTIAKEFYKNDIIYKSILEPASYAGLPVSYSTRL